MPKIFKWVAIAETMAGLQPPIMMKYPMRVPIPLILVLTTIIGCRNVPASGNHKGFSGRQPPQGVCSSASPTVAKINNISITQDDLNQEVELFNVLAPEGKPENKITTRERKLDYLKGEMVRRILLYQHALEKGLDKKKEIQRQLEKTKQDLLIVELAKEETARVEVTTAEIEEYYGRFKDQMAEPELRHIREIMVPTEIEAKDILMVLSQGANFEELARQRSQSASAQNGGDVGFIAKGKRDIQFDTAVFSDALEVGRYSDVFNGQDGYYIVKLEAKQGGRKRALAEVWQDIRRGLLFIKQQQRLEELIDTLSKQAKVEIYEGYVK